MLLGLKQVLLEFARTQVSLLLECERVGAKNQLTTDSVEIRTRDIFRQRPPVVSPVPGFKAGEPIYRPHAGHHFMQRPFPGHNT